MPCHWITPWRVTDTGISSPACEPGCLAPGEPMRWSCANWNYSTAYTVFLRKPGLLKQKCLHTTNYYFVLTLKKTLPSSSIWNANVICTSNNLGQYIVFFFFLWNTLTFLSQFFFPMGFVFLLTSPCFKNSPVEFFLNSSRIRIYCKVFTLHSISSDLYFGNIFIFCWLSCICYISDIFFNCLSEP